MGTHTCCNIDKMEETNRLKKMSIERPSAAPPVGLEPTTNGDISRTFAFFPACHAGPSETSLNENRKRACGHPHFLKNLLPSVFSACRIAIKVLLLMTSFLLLSNGISLSLTILSSHTIPKILAAEFPCSRL